MAELPAGGASRTAAIVHCLLGLLVLVALNLGGEWLARVAHVPVPGSVIGMLALTVLLESRLLPMTLVRSASELLVRHLALLYVPAGVALIVYAGIVREGMLAITVAALASLVAVLGVVGLIVEHVGRDG